MKEIFSLTFNQLLMLILFLALGWLLAKRKLLPKDADTVLAKLATYLMMPAMIVDTFAEQCTPDALHAEEPLLVIATIYILLAIAMSYPLSMLFAKPGEVRRVYRYSFAFTNVSYLGNVVLASVFGKETLFHYMAFAIPGLFATYTWGYLTLTKGQGTKFSFKRLLQPPVIAIVIGAAIGLTQLRLPTFLSAGIQSASACLGPIAMLLTGMTIARFDWRELLLDWRVYVATGLRLIVLPILITLAAYAIGVTGPARVCIPAVVCMPFGLNTVVFPASYGGDARPGASMVVVSHVLCVITIPIIFAIFFG